MRKAGVLFVALAGLAACPAWAEEEKGLEAIFETLAESPAKDALLQIPDPGRRLLALRSYARFRAPLVTRWSWTADEIEAYQGSAEQEALLKEVGEVAAHFAEANPGFELNMNTKVRSLDEQIRKWNKNTSVGVAGEEIHSAWGEKSGSAAWRAKQFWRWLKRFKPSARARLAAPGLSRHGRARAIDFQVKKDGKIIAGTSSADIETVWRAEKWDEKLKASIAAAGPSFKGPLVSPDEPWHYDYDPEAKAAASK